MEPLLPPRQMMAWCERRMILSAFESRERCPPRFIRTFTRGAANFAQQPTFRDRVQGTPDTLSHGLDIQQNLWQRQTQEPLVPSSSFVLGSLPKTYYCALERGWLVREKRVIPRPISGLLYDCG